MSKERVLELISRNTPTHHSQIIKKYNDKYGDTRSSGINVSIAKLLKEKSIKLMSGKDGRGRRKKGETERIFLRVD